MTEVGSHGGGSELEVSAVLLFAPAVAATADSEPVRPTSGYMLAISPNRYMLAISTSGYVCVGHTSVLLLRVRIQAGSGQDIAQRDVHQAGYGPAERSYV